MLSQVVALSSAKDVDIPGGSFQIFFRSFGEPSLPKPFLVDIWVLLQEVRAHWLVLFGYLLQFLQVLVELGKAWLGPKQPRVLPHVRSSDIAFLGVDVKLGDQSDLGLSTQVHIAAAIPPFHPWSGTARRRSSCHPHQ